MSKNKPKYKMPEIHGVAEVDLRKEGVAEEKLDEEKDITGEPLNGELNAENGITGESLEEEPKKKAKKREKKIVVVRDARGREVDEDKYRSMAYAVEKAGAKEGVVAFTDYGDHMIAVTGEVAKYHYDVRSGKAVKIWPSSMPVALLLKEEK